MKPKNEELNNLVRLVLVGAVTSLNEIWLHSEHVSPEYCINPGPLLGVTRSVLLQGFTFSSNNWNMVVRSNDWKGIKLFHLRDCFVSKNCSASVVKVCQRAKVAELEDVDFEDFREFSRVFLETKDPNGCEMIWFWNKTVSKHRKDILQLSKQLGWRVCRETEDDINIVQ